MLADRSRYSGAAAPLPERFSRDLSVTASYWLVAAICVGLRLASPATADLSYFALAGYALRGRSEAVQALFLCWLFMLLNPAIAPESQLASVARYVVILAACASVLMRSSLVMRRERLQRPPRRNVMLGATVLLGIFLFYHAILFSAEPMISLLKSISFTITMATLISAWSGMSEASRSKTTRFVFGGLCIVVAASLPLLVLPIGYLKNGTGFQGVLSHPQAFGVTLALIAAWLGGQFFVSRHLSILQWLVLAACPVLIILSQTRTAAGGLVLGLGASLLAMIAFSPRGSNRWKRSRIELLFFGAMALAVLAGPFLADRAQDFLLKSGRGNISDLTESIQASRGSLFEAMIENIRKHPMTGIGFGIASDPSQMEVGRDPIFNLPVGAPIEKGIMPVAVVEEVGIPGALLVAAWFVLLLRRAARGGIAALAVASTVVFLNLGEANFFSPGGMGMLLLILASWSATAENPTRKNFRASIAGQPRQRDRT
jgi:O-Antigen ligase